MRRHAVAEKGAGVAAEFLVQALYVGPQSSAAATEFDDMTMWIDTDSHGTIDEQQFAADFSSNEVALTYDHNGNLTSDGVFTHVYDGWNRLRWVNAGTVLTRSYRGRGASFTNRRTRCSFCGAGRLCRNLPE